ncbi:MAG: hypothetical protein WC657_07140 [Candidatus Paceibacterota bacterium]|jgi:hypothetical protein
MNPLPDLVVGALLALLGVLVSQFVAMLQAKLERQHKRDVLLRTKYEEFGQHFLESTEMPGRLLRCTTHEEIQGVLHQSAANQAQLLALIYFPPLREPIRRYMVSYQNLCLVVAEVYYSQADKEKSVGKIVATNQNYKTASIAHKMEKENLAEEIERHSVTYAKS